MIGDLIDGVHRLTDEPVDVVDQFTRVWTWVTNGISIPDWAGDAVGIVAILGGIVFVLMFATGGRKS